MSAKLLPGVKNLDKKTMVNDKEERIPDIKSEPTLVRRKRGPDSRVNEGGVEPSQVHTPTTSMEDEDVDDPSSVSPSNISKPPKVEPKLEDSPNPQD